MARYPAPASRTQPCKAWAAISEDVPPQIWEVGFYRDTLARQDLRHIRVMVLPDFKKRKTARKRK